MSGYAACADYHGREAFRERRADRRPLAIRGRIVWQDVGGRTRTAPICTRNVSEEGVLVDCIGATPIPLYRLVSLRLERAIRHNPRVPRVLRQGPVLAAVYRIGPPDPTTGAPASYALRLLIEPRCHAAAEDRAALAARGGSDAEHPANLVAMAGSRAPRSASQVALAS
jgi:hypothetical protein